METKMLCRLLKFQFSQKSTTVLFAVIVCILDILHEKGNVMAMLDSQPGCSLEAIEECRAPLIKYLRGKDYIIAVNKTQLLEVCKEIRPVVDCSDDYLARCTQSSALELGKMFSGFRTFIHDVCEEDSEFSKEYLRHAPCMAQFQSQIHHCETSSTSSMANTSTSDLSLNSLCCTMSNLLKCTKDVYNENCGKDAANLGFQTLANLFGPIIRKACTDEYGYDMCSGCSYLLLKSNSIFIISVATLLVSFRIIGP
ncbi:hypothetical protein CHUAL_001742 [Chamberlinius hualienensis]